MAQTRNSEESIGQLRTSRAAPSEATQAEPRTDQLQLLRPSFTIYVPQNEQKSRRTKHQQKKATTFLDEEASKIPSEIANRFKGEKRRLSPDFETGQTETRARHNRASVKVQTIEPPGTSTKTRRPPRNQQKSSQPFFEQSSNLRKFPIP